MGSFVKGSRFGFGILVLATAFGPAAHAKKPPQVRPWEVEESVAMPGMSLSAASAATRMLADVNYPTTASTPELAAREYLTNNAALYKMDPSLSDLVFDATFVSPGGYHVHFHQQVRNLNVEDSDITVTFDRNRNVTFVMSNYRPVTSLEQPGINSKRATQTASAFLSLTDPNAQRSSVQIVYVDRTGQARPAHRVHLVSPKDHVSSYDVIVDGITGQVLRARDGLVYDTAPATVFDPNPVIKSGNVYGTGGISNYNGADNAILTGLLTQVQLTDLLPSGGTTGFTVAGTYAVPEDFEPPTNPNCSRDTKDFSATRGTPCFNEVNAYYFITKQLKYINEQLGFHALPIQYSGGIHYDAYGNNGEDNSHYDPSAGKLSFGTGGVPDAQDHDVVLHELGHALHDWLTGGHLSQVDGLSEGIADYFASSYSRQFMTASHPAYNWTFSWDGHNEYWPGRVVNDTNHYPTALTGEVHADGEMWASAMGAIYIDIGKLAADRDMLEAMTMLTGTANQNDTANAVLKADLSLYPDGSHQASIRQHFTDRGYTLTQ